jgi:hypothetical protein
MRWKKSLNPVNPDADKRGEHDVSNDHFFEKNQRHKGG